MKEDKIKVLLENITENFVSSELLASKLGVSSKTVRKQLKDLNTILEQNGAYIETKPKKGFKLIINNQDKYNKFLSSLINKNTSFPQSYEQRVNFIIEYLLYADNWIKIEDLCDMLYIGQSSISKCLKDVRSYFYEYNIQLLNKPGYGLKIDGREFDYRKCIANIKGESLLKDYENNSAGRKILKCISKVLNEAFEKFNYQMSDVSYQNLIIHIYVAILRIKEGQETKLSNEQMTEIMDWEEYPMAEELVLNLSNILEINIPKYEIAYIAIHLAAKKIVSLNDEKNGNVVINDEVYEIVSHMLNVIYKSYQIDLRDDLDLRMMLSLHLVSFGVRMAYDIVLHNPILKDIKTQYTMAYNLAVTASDELRKHYNKNIKEDEIGYFALHFNLALERKKELCDKKNILIVCGTGRGTAQLLLYQFKKNFGKYLNQIQTCDILGVKNVDFKNIDYVITTIPIKYSVPVPILEIKSFVIEKDIDNIHKLLTNKTSGIIDKYIHKGLFITDLSCDTKEEVLQYMVNEIKKYYIDIPYNFYDAILYREKLAVTEFGNLVATPHPYKVITKILLCVFVY